MKRETSAVATVVETHRTTQHTFHLGGPFEREVKQRSRAKYDMICKTRRASQAVLLLLLTHVRREIEKRNYISAASAANPFFGLHVSLFHSMRVQRANTMIVFRQL